MMESKKKLYVITEYYPYGNGEKTFLEPELKRLLETGKFDITIISNSIEGSKLTSTVDRKIKVIHVPQISIVKRPVQSIKYCVQYFFSKATKKERLELKSKCRNSGQLFDSLFFYVRACTFYHDLVKKVPFEEGIIYTYWCNTQTLAFVLHKDELRNIKIISRIHGFDLYDERTVHGRQPFRRTINDKLDKLYFIAQAGMEYYAKKIDDKTGEKYVLSRLGTERVENGNPKLEADEERLGFLLISCSNVIPIKRIGLIIQALGEIEEFNVAWIHFGDGNERESLEQKAIEILKNKTNIQYEFKGQTDNKDILSFYRENFVDCFITTSKSEGCPVSIQEAMSCGLPIIATSVGEIPNMINGNGILLSENPSSVEIANAIKKLHYMSKTDVLTMRSKSISLWEQYFDADKNYKSFAESLVDL